METFIWSDPFGAICADFGPNDEKARILPHALSAMALVQCSERPEIAPKPITIIPYRVKVSQNSS
ncbi:hypothetical protein DS909_14295 [Phaeobacter gallaeciensis]|uniref:Uncharacterized protein n=1 Tax=Phaeobacter gallaeciensis TaxID=60890 RepID=A0A366WUB7_9RHOB|nr:hypothetical protein DS909_14295 [Phaeobacter gallaeciensis]